MKKRIALLFFSLALHVQAQIAQRAEDISPLLIGEKIPVIELTDPEGKSISSKEVFAQKTVLLVYRGGWCPYCSTQLMDMQTIESQIINLGYKIVAVSPDAPSFLKETISEGGINYALYSDSEGKFAQAIGVAFKKDKPKLDRYSEGKNPGFLPVPTVYVVDDKREIAFMYLNPKYTTRLKGELLLAVLKNL
ncbi:peroxiredoxin family protein [Flavobacterium crassostreae]|uniref:thioredoxin-dependent peroxiredoxin n=1 Tax=Flavobacterium crassostreae TaxID=1763534 RepID=A0A1B9E046_9FLAO|nr:peroxiredoxin family protein [Flavobacterium crassostreae]OCB75323.1 antioxidant AhpC [Flavobacterium crassostreae]